jgi:hypothetical protein
MSIRPRGQLLVFGAKFVVEFVCIDFAEARPLFFPAEKERCCTPGLLVEGEATIFLLLHGGEPLHDFAFMAGNQTSVGSQKIISTNTSMPFRAQTSSAELPRSLPVACHPLRYKGLLPDFLGTVEKFEEKQENKSTPLLSLVAWKTTYLFPPLSGRMAHTRAEHAGLSGPVKAMGGRKWRISERMSSQKITRTTSWPTLARNGFLPSCPCCHVFVCAHPPKQKRNEKK